MTQVYLVIPASNISSRTDEMTSCLVSATLMLLSVVDPYETRSKQAELCRLLGLIISSW